MVIKTENNKQSTIDFTNARETEADDERIASIKEVKEANEALILEAEGKLKVIKRIVQATTKRDSMGLTSQMRDTLLTMQIHV